MISPFLSIHRNSISLEGDAYILPLVWEVLQTLLAGLVMWHSQQYLGISFVFVIHQPDCRLSGERIQGLPK